MKQNPRKLANRLAAAAHTIAPVCGDDIAQVIAYSLFLSKFHPDFEPPNMGKAHLNFPETACIQTVLDEADIGAVFASYTADDKDPSIYFFEEFQRAYDPAASRSRGVHYSPPEVVSYIVRSVETILTSEFNLSFRDAVVVDPCCGIGTFLYHIERNYDDRPNMTGVELLNAPYQLASQLLRSARIIQANSLGNIPIDTGSKLLTIIGNPPYSGHSANPGKIQELMTDYRTGLAERNPKWLQDDYVKFFRAAQARIEEESRGIVAFITNHSYIFNPTFRAMRASLMNAFDEIYVLDLHGNAKIAEAEQDENIFPIQMGVAISILVKRSNNKACKIRYAQLRGSKRLKMTALSSTELYTTDWQDVHQVKPFYLFIPNKTALQEDYYGFASLFDIFESGSVGFVTSRDAFAIDVNRETLIQRIADLRNPNISPAEVREKYKIGDLNVEKARRILLEDSKWESKAAEVLYRPFDCRWAYLSSAVMERPRLPFMTNLLEDNIAIAVGRAGQVTGSAQWDVIFCTDRPADLNLFRRGGAMLLPLYIYREQKRHYNMRAGTSNPEELFYYIYAILHSRLYREKYSDLLAIDYPRIPIPPDKRFMCELAVCGKALTSTHLLHNVNSENSETFTRIGGYPIPGKLLELREDIPKEYLGCVRSAIMKTTAIQEEIDSAIRRANLI